MNQHCLGTDLLEQHFGMVRPEVVLQSDSSRITAMRTCDGALAAYSLVTFLEGVSRVPHIHQEILEGGAIGKIFRTHGVQLEREEKCAFLYTFPEKLRSIFKCEERCGFVKYVHLHIKTGDVPMPYAAVIEIYSPRIQFPTPFETEEGLGCLVDSMLDQHFARKENP